MLLAAAPPEALPQAGEVAKPLLGLHLSDEEKAAAREARAQAQRQSRGAPAAAALAPPPGARADPPAAALAPAAFAISTRPLRTRAEAEQLQTAMRGLLQAQGGAALSLELLPQNDDWRVVAWPFAAQADADAARSLLASRGMRVEVVHF